MSAAAGAVVLLFVIGVGGSVLLYWFVRAEHHDREVMTRDDAERAARRDTRDEE